MTTTHAQVITAPDQRTVTFLFPTQTTPVLRGDGKEIPSSSGTHGAHGTYHPHGSSVQSICAVSERDGYRLYTGSRDSCTNVFQLRRGRRDYQHVASLQGHVDWVNDVVALGDGGDGIVGTCSSDGTCRVWGADGGLRTCLAGHGDYVTGLASALVRPRLWSCGLGKLGGEVFGWDVEEGRRCVSFAGVELGQSAYCVASLGGIASFSDCVCVGLSGRERNVVVLDGRSEEMVCRLMGHEGTVRRAVVGGGMVYTGGGDGLIKGWDLRYVQEGVGGHHPVHTIRCHGTWLLCHAVSC
jgi:WD40 repeat protein